MDREREFWISGIDWLETKLTPEDGLHVESEADLADWKAADWEKIAGRCRTGHDWCELLKLRPSLVGKCDWTKFGGDDWTDYLCDHPEAFDKCNYSLLSDCDWTFLLGKQPQLADQYDWMDFDGDRWAHLLGEQPQFAKYCDWEKLDGRDWSYLVSKQFRFAGLCPWEKLNVENWKFLLNARPELIFKCDPSVFDDIEELYMQSVPATEHSTRSAETVETAVRKLLRGLPNSAEDFDWRSLNGEDWSYLLSGHPEFAEHCA